MNSSIFLPKKINVGFQNRSDTYTKKLAYIIYYDEKGTLRKETSWNSWRDKELNPIEYDNVPTSGFVLNKKVGGYSSGWNFRQSYVRIYDPRDFEFEITVANLLYILENTNSIKGKGLEGEFTYGWDGKDLLLIPTSSPDYVELTNFNNKLFNNDFVKAKNLTLGATYLTKDNHELIYMGKYDYWESVKIHDGYTENSNSCYFGNRRYENYHYEDQITGKRFYFCSLCDNQKQSFNHLKTISKKFISVVDENCVENYSDLFDKLECDKYYSPIDEDKEEYISYTLEEFINSFVNEHRSSYILHKINEKYDTVYIYRGENNLYQAYGKDELTSIETIFEKYKPVYRNRYLMNGNLYERSY